MEGIIPIVLGIIVLLIKDFLLDYYEKVNRKFGNPVDRKVMYVRLMMGAFFLIIIRLTMVLKSEISAMMWIPWILSKPAKRWGPISSVYPP